MDLVMLEFRVQDDSKEWYGELSNSFAFFNGFLDWSALQRTIWCTSCWYHCTGVQNRWWLGIIHSAGDGSYFTCWWVKQQGMPTRNSFCILILSNHYITLFWSVLFFDKYSNPTLEAQDFPINFGQFDWSKSIDNVLMYIEESFGQHEIQSIDLNQLSADGVINAIGLISEYTHQNEWSSGFASGIIKFSQPMMPILGHCWLNLALFSTSSYVCVWFSLRQVGIKSQAQAWPFCGEKMEQLMIKWSMLMRSWVTFVRPTIFCMVRMDTI